MADLSELLEFSFRGAVALYRKGSKSFGRKNTDHEYPNRDDRYVEDLGGLDDTFSVSAVITGDDWRQKRDAFEQALRQKGSGQLVHPLYGSVTVAVKNVTVNEDLSMFGEIGYELEFKKTLAQPIYPQGTVVASASILRDIQTINEATTDWIAENFFVSARFPRNFTDAVETIENLTNTFEGTVSGLFSNSGITELSRSILNLVDNAKSFIKDPFSLGESLVDIMEKFQTIMDDPAELVNVNAEMFDVGDDIPLLIEKTQGRIERQSNRDILNISVQGLALANAIQQASLVEYFDVTQLDATTALIDDKFDDISEHPKLAPVVRETLQTARTKLRDYLKEQQAVAYRINEVTVNQIPMTILSYQYYGDTDNVEKLLALNDTVYAPAVEGPTKLFVR